MNALQHEFAHDGFHVLGFPCNQFARQEPGANGTEILNGVKYVRPGGGFVPNFQLFEKIDVNGANEHPLYTYLKSRCGPTHKVFRSTMIYYQPIAVSDVWWNWETFLVDHTGNPVIRFNPVVNPADIRSHIVKLLIDKAAAGVVGK